MERMERKLFIWCILTPLGAAFSLKPPLDACWGIELQSRKNSPMYMEHFPSGCCWLNIVQPLQTSCPCKVPHPSAAEIPEAELGALGGPRGKVNQPPLTPYPCWHAQPGSVSRQVPWVQQWPRRANWKTHLSRNLGLVLSFVTQIYSLGRGVSALVNRRQRG